MWTNEVVTRGSPWWNWLFGDQEDEQVAEEPVDVPSQKTEQPDKETKEFIKEEVKDKAVEEVIYMPFRPVQNLNLEKTALNEFVKIVKRLPAGKDWESIHFLAYGNAVTSRLTLRVERVF